MHNADDSLTKLRRIACGESALQMNRLTAFKKCSTKRKIITIHFICPNKNGGQETFAHHISLSIPDDKLALIYFHTSGTWLHPHEHRLDALAPIRARNLHIHGYNRS